MEIQTKNAYLELLAVTIQALHVNGKQMTLAVFRQIPKARAYNEDGSLAPLEYWGIVRYSIKDEGDMWVVAASGGRLYRCCLYEDNLNVKGAEARLAGAQGMLSWWRSECIARKDPLFKSRVQRPYFAPDWESLDVGELEHEVFSAEMQLQNCLRADVTRAALERLTQLFIAV